MKDASTLDTVQRFIRPLNISGKTINSHGADPAPTTPKADRSGRALQADVSTGPGGTRMQFCAPAKDPVLVRALPRWRQEDFNRQMTFLPSLRPHRANRKVPWREGPQEDEIGSASTWQAPNPDPTRSRKSDLYRHLRETCAGACRKQ